MFLWKCLGTNSCSLRCCSFAVYKLQAFSNFALDRLATSSPTSSDPQSISPTSEVRNCSFISVLAMMCLDIVLPFACRQYTRSIHVRFVHHIHTTSTPHPHDIHTTKGRLLNLLSSGLQRWVGTLIACCPKSMACACLPTSYFDDHSGSPFGGSAV